MVGVVNSTLLSVVMVSVFQAGLSPMPRPPSVAFASVVLGGSQPLSVGLALHLVYVTFWSVLFIAATYPRATFIRSLGLGLALWLVASLVFFPVIGWGLLGLGVGPRLIVAALVPHALFSVFLWALTRLAFREIPHRRQAARH